MSPRPALEGRVLVVSPPEWRERLALALTCAGPVVWSATAPERASTGADAVVVAAPPWMEPPEWAADEPNAIIVIVPYDRRRARLAARAGRAPILLDRVELDLPRALRAALTPALLDRSGLRALAALPWPFRRGRRIVLETELLSVSDAVEILARRGHPFPRDLVRVAARVGCSPDHLARLGRSCGVSASRTIRAATLYPMYHVRLRTGAPLERVAVRFGFNHAAGATNFCERLTGLSFAGAEERGFQRWRAWLFGEVIPPEEAIRERLERHGKADRDT